MMQPPSRSTTRRIATAIDPDNGETLWMWRLDEGIRWQKAPRQFAGRGLSYWTDGDTRNRGMAILPAISDTRELWKESNGSANGYYGIIAPCMLEGRAMCTTPSISRAIRMAGNESWTSATRMMKASMRPPK